MKFQRANFQYFGGYLTYAATSGAERLFVARFKYGNKAGFLSFLIKNFEVEEYFRALDGGAAPATILETKGYVCDNVKKALARYGYPVTQAGFKQLIRDQIAYRDAHGSEMPVERS